MVRIRARSFSRVKRSREEELERKGRRAFRDVVGEAFVALRSIPTTEMYSLDE